MTIKLTDKMQFQQTYYGEIWGTVNPNIVSPTRPIATLQHSAQHRRRPEPGLVADVDDEQQHGDDGALQPDDGASASIKFFEDLTTPNRQDTAPA